MGSSRRIYVGPYLEVPHREKMRTTHKVVCVNEKCRNHDMETKTNFCSQCGMEPQNKRFETPYMESAHEFLNNNGMEDTLIGVHTIVSVRPENDIEILIPNHRLPEESMGHIDENFSGGIELYSDDNVRARNHTSWVLTKYTKEIHALSDAGFVPKIKWGLVSYYS